MMFVRALALLLALSGSALAQSGQIPSGRVWGNAGATKAIASPATFTAMFDRALGSTTGAVIARSAATWGLVSGTTTTVLHGNAGGSPSFGSVVAADVATNTLTNATLAQAAAWTLKGNATASTANVTDFTITGLTSKATPVGADEILLSDSAASNAFKKTTVTAVATAVAPTVLAGAVTSLNGHVGAVTIALVPQGRLTLQSATAVMTTTQSAKTTIYYTPFVGDFIPLWNGADYVLTEFSELSALTTDTTKSPAAIGASKVNDWFVWNDAGTIRLGHGPDWTNDTTRSAGTALLLWRGAYLNNVAITNGPGQGLGTYVGTTRSNGSSQLDWIIGSSAAGGGTASFYVWNAYNQVNVATAVQDSAASWTYSTNTVRSADNSAGNRVNFVSGLPLHGLSASYSALIRPASINGAWGEIGIALDSTSSSLITVRVGNNAASLLDINQIAPWAWGPQLGAHFVQATELGDGGNTTTYFAAGTRSALLFQTMM